MLYLSLTQNYAKREMDIHHEKIRFNLKNDDAIEKHMRLVSNRVKVLKEMYVLPPLFLWINILTTCIPRNNFEHTVFILHTHSDDTRGDLFYTCGDKGKKSLSIDIESVSLNFKVSLRKPIDGS